jgi:hypothetical protein
MRAALALASAAGLWLGAAAPASAVQHAAKKHATTAASAKAKIISDWEAFFSGKTPAKKKIALVEDGSAFAKVIEDQAKSNPMAATTTAKVSKVTVSGNKATVVYTIDLSGQPALSNQKGQAVLQRGTWKVGTASFCALLALEGTKVGVCSSAAKK